MTTPTLGECRVCSRPLHDHHPDHVATFGLGPEVVCARCHEWWRSVTRWFLTKTRRFPGQDTPPHGTRIMEPSASVYV
jgi:hypothetical protein